MWSGRSSAKPRMIALRAFTNLPGFKRSRVKASRSDMLLGQDWQGRGAPLPCRLERVVALSSLHGWVRIGPKRRQHDQKEREEAEVLGKLAWASVEVFPVWRVGIVVTVKVGL